MKWGYASTDAEPDKALRTHSDKDMHLLFKLTKEGLIFAIQDQAKRLGKKNESFIPFARKLLKLANGFDRDHIEAVIKRIL